MQARCAGEPRRHLLRDPGIERADPAAATDAQLTALMQQHKEQLMLPERRRLSVVRFSAKALAPTLTVDPKAVEQQFEAKKASYGKPETRSLVEIPLNDPSKATEVAAAPLPRARIRNAVAKSVGVDAVSYADQPQAAIADCKAGAAAFAMKEGQVSGPVQGDFKTVVIKVTKVTPPQAPTSTPPGRRSRPTCGRRRRSTRSTTSARSSMTCARAAPASPTPPPRSARRRRDRAGGRRRQGPVSGQVESRAQPEAADHRLPAQPGRRQRRRAGRRQGRVLRRPRRPGAAARDCQTSTSRACGRR